MYKNVFTEGAWGKGMGTRGAQQLLSRAAWPRVLCERIKAKTGESPPIFAFYLSKAVIRGIGVVIGFDPLAKDTEPCRQ